MHFFKDFLQVFFPNLCLNCNNQLLYSEKILCSVCRNDLPLTLFKSLKNNSVIHTFYGRLPLETGNSLLYFNKFNTTQKLVHYLKYKNRQDIGTFLAQWFGHELKEQNVYDSVDCIIPVPIHPKKLKRRGYNQISSFCKTLGKLLEIPCEEELLIKVSDNSSQTFKSRFERYKDIQTNFKLTDTVFLENKHVLLIDDVITTGATIVSCCEELLKTENIKISVLSIAFTKNT